MHTPPVSRSVRFTVAAVAALVIAACLFVAMLTLTAPSADAATARPAGPIATADAGLLAVGAALVLLAVALTVWGCLVALAEREARPTLAESMEAARTVPESRRAA